MSESVPIPSVVSSADLIPDRALREVDEDAFNHEAIASNLAEHVATAETPLNVALYGPWGSGKSSAFELLRRRLATRPIKLVRYDASRYGGESLRRNFISHAASELGFDDGKEYRHFHGGLYEGRRTAAVEMPGSLRDWKTFGSPVFTIAVTLFALLLVVAAAGWGVSYLTNDSPLGQISALLTGLAVPAGVLALLVAAAKATLDGATITTEQSRPSADEEFGRCFGQLVEAALSKHRVKRLVFFVDELDRCSRADVVDALRAIKTFLDHEHCVFVVAADRDVLEQALTTHLQQATPLNEDNPYYSSASSFLDKVFHHQMFLPPLRTMKLTHFARDLVFTRGGLWAELRESGGQRALDRVIYALVPSHVVSPRRVKVLLNNFATNARVIESRGIEWKARAPEIAKLTVLQTEFPSVAADLPQEPRLPEMLLDAPPSPSPRLRRLLVRHGVAYDEEGGPDSSPGIASEDAPATDPLLPSGGDAQDEAARKEIVSVQHRDLRRYLKRTKGVGITGPGRDLLYLESVGEFHGLEDIALSEIIEADAVEEPDNVISAIAGRSDAAQLAAMHILCDISQGEFGDERANVITALMGVVEQSDADTGGVAARIVESLRSFQAEQELAPGHLVGALEIALALDAQDGRALFTQISTDPRLFDAPTRTRRIAVMLDRLEPEFAEAVIGNVADQLATDSETLREPLRVLRSSAALTLLSHAAIREAVGERYTDLSENDPAAADKLAQSLYADIEARQTGQSELLKVLQWLFLSRSLAYPIVRAHAEQTMDTMAASEERDSHALVGLDEGGSSDWEFWRPYLGTDATKSDWRPEVISRIAESTLADAQRSEAQATARALAPHAARLDAGEIGPITEALSAALGDRTWWSDETELAEQRDVYATAVALTDLADTDLKRAVHAMLAEDALRVMKPPVARPGYGQLPSPFPTVAAQKGLRALGAMLAVKDRQSLIEQLCSALPSGDSTVDAQILHTTMALAASVRAAGGSADVGDPEVFLSALNAGPVGAAAATDWLAIDPSAETLAAIAGRLTRNPATQLAEALDGWARRHDSSARTTALEALLDVDVTRTGSRVPQLEGTRR